jgi:hypothetical protein
MIQNGLIRIRITTTFHSSAAAFSLEGKFLWWKRFLVGKQGGNMQVLIKNRQARMFYEVSPTNYMITMNHYFQL